MPTRPGILIADDHILVAELCKRLLEAEYHVLGTVNNGRALVKAAAELQPDVIILDIAMPVLNGLDAGEQIKEARPRTKLIYLTMNPAIEVAAEAFRRGASGYLLKTCACSEMLIAVREVLRGYTYISRALPQETINDLRRQDKEMVEECLTKREREVLQLLSEGKVMKEVGTILNMSPRTVAFHKYRIMERLGVTNNAELTRYAIRNYIIAA